MTARHVVRGLLAVLIAAGAVVLASYEIYHLVRTGSCASGGPYVSARPCPAGTGGRILLLIAAIFVMAPAAVAVFATRARGVKGVAGAGALTGLLWTFGWIAMGSAAWVAGHGPAAPADGGEGSTAVAITFWALGGFSLLGGLLLVRGARAGERAVTQRAARAPAPAPAPPPRPVQVQQLATALGAVAHQRTDAAEVDDVARRLKQLDELQAMGAITADEHAAKRREILGEI